MGCGSLRWEGDGAWVREIQNNLGFMICLQCCRRLLPKALSFWAPPCHSWIFLSRHTYKRSPNDIFGDLDNQEAQLQNRLVKRVCLLLRFLTACGVFWVVEQPQSSLLRCFPAFMKLRCKRVFFHMKSYGAPNPKGTVLWGTAPWLKRLKRKLSAGDRLANDDKEVTVKTVGPRGATAVSGGKDLSETQSYPPLFGVSCASYHTEFMNGKADSDSEISDSSSEASDDSCSCISELLESPFDVC